MAEEIPGVGPDVNIGGSALAVIWTMICLASIVVFARLWVQARITRQLGLSDAFMTLSLATIIGMASLLSEQYHYGWGRHFAYIAPENRVHAVRLNVIGQSFGIMGSTWGRLSCILLMLQLFGNTKKTRIVLWFLFATQLIFNGITVICIYVQCTDVRALWDQTIQARCWPPMVQTNIAYAHTSYNAATDLFLTILPATVLWTLQMKLKLKIGLCVILGMSLFAFVAVIMKIVKLHVLSERGDYTYNTVQMFTWVITEGCLVDIAASVPLIRPLFTRSGINSTRNTYDMNNISGNKGTSSSRIYTSRRGSGTMKLGDGVSEEDILHPQGTVRTNSTIMKKTSYAVEYDMERQQKNWE